jgi:ABC-2 type transport system ATP-binding protein
MTARLAFSIATIVNPEILIVDEILSVGDLNFQEKSRKKMEQMIKEEEQPFYLYRIR